MNLDCELEDYIGMKMKIDELHDSRVMNSNWFSVNPILGVFMGSKWDPMWTDSEWVQSVDKLTTYSKMSS